MAGSDTLPGRVGARLKALVDLLESTGPLVVAVSGGADSVCLLQILRNLSDAEGWRIHAAHLNHGQRPEAAEEALWVEDLCRRLDCPCTVGVADVPELARCEHLSLEVAGRRARYRFIADLCTKLNTDIAVTAHHMDDVAETVLLRTLQGSGPIGIPAIAPMPESGGRLRVIRPLLSVRRREIVRYLQAAGLEWLNDPTNVDRRYPRNRIRAELMPLAESIVPGSARGLARSADVWSDDARYLDGIASEAWDRRARREAAGWVIDLTDSASEPALLRRLVRRAVLEAGGVPRASSVARIQERIASARPGARPLRLADGLMAEWNGVELRISSDGPGLPPIAYSIELTIPGRAIIDEIGKEVVVEWAQGGEYPPYPARTALTAIVDPACVSGPLEVRTWEPGDRVKVFGKGGTRKLQDLFTDAKWPGYRRRSWPVVCDARGVLWVPGLVLRETARVIAPDQPVLRLEMADEAVPEA